jgi:AraC-like DNA-binding protein
MNSDALRQNILRQVAPEGQLLQLFDLLPDVSFFIKDTRGRFVAVNRRGCEYCGVRSEREVLGKTDYDFFPRSRADKFTADDRKVLKSGKPLLNVIHPAPEAEGSPRLVVTNRIPLRDASGRVIGLAGFSRSVENVRARPVTMAGLARALDHLHDRHAEPVATKHLAKLAGRSASQFERVFRKTLGTSPRQYLLRVRVEAACRALVETDDKLSVIAQRCGFYDQPHFTRSFTALMGATPSAYRRERRSPQPN